MPTTDSHGRPIIVAAPWFGKMPARPRKLKPGEQPPAENPPTPTTLDEADDARQRRNHRDAGDLGAR